MNSLKVGRSFSMVSVENEFQKACDKYTEAIHIFPTAILYCKKQVYLSQR